MESERLCDSLFTWLRTFSSVSGVEDCSEITDGVVMAKVLNQIDSKYFDDAWLSRIKTDASSNWRLKVSNLKKILKGIMDYYVDVLGQHIQDFQMPDVNAIGERGDASELGRLLQLILGCAVNCDHKQQYIEVIMGMEEHVQHVVMNAIQELMTKETPATAGNVSEIRDQNLIDELNAALQAREEFAQRCHELDLQVAALQEEKIQLQDDNHRLLQRVDASDVNSDVTSSASTSRKAQQLQFQCDKQVDEIYRLEAARDDYKARVDQQVKEIDELKLRIDELTIQAEESRMLKDEVDVLKHSSEKAAKYESTIEMYKKKLDDMSDLRRQMKLLEEKNEVYMTQNMELEEELRKSGAMKSQIDMYKRQVQELQTKASDETKRADKAEFAITRAEAKVTALEREKETLVLERDSLRETNEELTLSKMHDGPSEPSAGRGDLSASPNLEMMAIPPEVRERLIRLQHENKMLKLNAPKASDDQVLLQTMLDDANSRKNELESELRISNQRIIELEAQVDDMRDKQLASASDDHSELRRKLNELQRKIKDYESGDDQSKAKIEQLEIRLTDKQTELTRVQEQLTKKTDDMKNMEEKYKKYFEKAKSVIRQLDPKSGSGSELLALKNQLLDKEKLIQHLERDHNKYKSVREQEEKLIVSAWYNMGAQLQRKASEDRLTSSNAGQSFLARQRQATNKRLQNIPGAHQTSSSDYLEY